MKEKIIFDTIIVGAGPAGLFTACHLSNDNSVLILERNPRPGVKLLLSGGGQCNLTNSVDPEEFPSHYYEARNWVKPALLNYTSHHLQEFFASNAVTLMTREDGKVFPTSLKAEDILTALLKEAEEQCQIIYDENVLHITLEEDLFQIRTARNLYTSRNVVIATGGFTYPYTGSDGNGYRLGRELGHTVSAVTGGLTPLICEDEKVRELSGVLIEKVVIKADKHKVQGNLLFTHKGLSGTSILNLSHYIPESMVISVDYLPELSFEATVSLLNKVTNNNRKLLNSLHETGLPESLLYVLLYGILINHAKVSNQLSKKEILKIAEVLKMHKLSVINENNRNSSMVSVGGISLKEVNSKTMESRIVPKLYFAGEILDVDGEAGGFNLQFAFSSGYSAAKAILRR